LIVPRQPGRRSLDEIELAASAEQANEPAWAQPVRGIEHAAVAFEVNVGIGAVD
jgi:hypothetical protein